jgi:hypothetical protein
VVLEMRYRHPRTGAVLEIQQAVRVRAMKRSRRTSATTPS